jgi:hypothetical protein
VKSHFEVERLKQGWKRDPIWDIEETEGFEEHKQELLQFRLRCEAEWKEAHLQKLQLKARQIGVPDNLTLAAYVLALEDRLDKIERMLGEERPRCPYR